MYDDGTSFDIIYLRTYQCYMVHYMKYLTNVKNQGELIGKINSDKNYLSKQAIILKFGTLQPQNQIDIYG